MRTLPSQNRLRDHAASFYCGTNAAAATATAMVVLPDNLLVKAMGGGIAWVYTYAATGSLMSDLSYRQAHCDTKAWKFGAASAIALLYSAAAYDGKMPLPFSKVAQVAPATLTQP